MTGSALGRRRHRARHRALRAGRPSWPAAVAETVEVAGALQSSGHPDAQPRNTQGPATTELASGLDALRTNAPTGGKVSVMMADGPLFDAVPGAGTSRRESVAFR